MYCQKCGTKLPKGSVECPKCGEKQGNGNQQVKLRSTSELLKQSIEILKINWKNYLIISAFVVVTETIYRYIVNGQAGLFASSASFEQSVVSLPVFVSLSIVEFVLISFFGFSLLRSVYEAAGGKKESIQDSLSYAIKNFLPYFAITILTGLGIGAGVILLVIPGIILALMWSMVPAIFVLEGNHGINVFQRSKELVAGYKWAILGRILLYGLILVAFAFIFGFVTGILGIPLEKIPIASFIYGNLVDLVVTVVTGILGSSFMYFIYQDLVGIKGQKQEPVK
jgi:hypothetical protein